MHGSGKAERGPLLVPAKRQSGMRQQLVCGQIARLAAVEDRLGDVRGEIAEANEPGEIGRAHALPPGQSGKRHAIAGDECGIELARSDQQLDQPRIRFCCGKRVGSLDQHPDLPSRAPQPYRDAQDLDFLFRRPRQSRRCDIQDRTKPCLAELDVDLIGPDVDAFDQGGKQGTLAYCGQLGPAVSNFPGARDQPALR